MYIRVKWLITSKYMQWRRPYRYLVKSVRKGETVEQVYIKYVGPGIAGGWEGRVPDAAHPDWAGETVLDLEDEYGSFSSEDRKKHPVQMSRKKGLIIRNFRKGPVLTFGNEEVTIWADEDFWHKKSNIPLAMLQDMTVETGFTLNRLPPGMLKDVNNIYFTNLNCEEGTLAYYDPDNKDITVMAAQIRDDHKGVDYAIPHEVTHGHFHSRWNAAEAKAMKDKKWKAKVAAFYKKSENKKPKGFKADKPSTWGSDRVELHEEMWPQVLNKDRDLKAFFKASSEEGPLTKYSKTYYSEEHMTDYKTASEDGRVVQVYYKHYVNENLAEATHVWFSSDSTYEPSGKAKSHPKTFDAFSVLMAKQAKGWSVHYKTGRPPSSQEKTYADRRKASNEMAYHANVAQYEDGMARHVTGARKTIPKRKPYHPARRERVPPVDQDKLAALKYRKYISVAEALYWREKGYDIDPKGLPRETMAAFRKEHGMRAAKKEVVPKSKAKVKAKARAKATIKDAKKPKRPKAPKTIPVEVEEGEVPDAPPKGKAKASAVKEPKRTFPPKTRKFKGETYTKAASYETEDLAELDKTILETDSDTKARVYKWTSKGHKDLWVVYVKEAPKAEKPSVIREKGSQPTPGTPKVGDTFEKGGVTYVIQGHSTKPYEGKVKGSDVTFINYGYYAKRPRGKVTYAFTYHTRKGSDPKGGLFGDATSLGSRSGFESTPPKAEKAPGRLPGVTKGKKSPRDEGSDGGYRDEYTGKWVDYPKQKPQRSEPRCADCGAPTDGGRYCQGCAPEH